MSGEFEWEADESEQYEGSEETELYEEENESPFNEIDEMEMAAQLLEVSDEDELDQFLGNLLKKAGRAVGGFVRSPTGQALGGILKGAASKALPIVGSAIGSAIGGSAGGRIGGKLASTAGQLFGLELEGLSAEDQEFEVARRFVRFAGAAANRAAKTTRRGPPQAVARSAALSAARRHAPGLLRSGPGRFRGRRRRGPRMGGGGGINVAGLGGAPEGATDDGLGMDPTGDGTGSGQDDAFMKAAGLGDGDPSAAAGGGRAGRWLRRGRQIIVFNC